MKIDRIECINLRFEYPGPHGFQSSGGIVTSRVTSPEVYTTLDNDF